MTFAKKTDALVYERKVLEAKSLGVVTRPKNLRITFLEWSEEWLSSKARRPGTEESYTRNVRRHMQPAFGGMRLHRIEPKDVQAWVVGLSQSGLAPRTVHLIYKTFRACINSAVRKRVLQHSPCVDVDLPEVRRKHIVPATREQVWALYEAMPAHLRALIMVGAGCGLRSGEAFGLCQDVIDFEAGVLVVRRQVIKVRSKPHLVDYNKTFTSHEREVPLPAFAHRALRDHLDAHAVLVTPQGEHVVFPSSRGNLLRRDGFYKWFKKALAAAGLPPTFRYHDLRHTFASHALDQGIPKATVQLYLGHASEDVLNDVYHHQVKGAAARDRNALEAVFFEETADVDVPSTIEVDDDAT
ncbi:tyrosine-type recombinase/integrase [Yinghuangia aomiensis]